MPAESGIPFGQYVLLRRIARGGMAEVFLAQQRGLEGFDRRVAVKRILPQLADSPDFVKMFMGEARLAAQLSHPNVVHIYEFGKVDEDYFIAMEYVEGVHAGQIYKHGTTADRLTPTLVARIGADAATALHHAHELRGLGLVHRDVSPANIMVSFDGVVKLCDFGIAKAAALGDQLTNPGQVKGKYAYMSPEQTSAQPLDGRSDVFSLSIVLWELLSGTYIVPRGDAVAAMRALRDGRIEPLSKIAPKVPVALAEAVMWGLQTQREDRATATELAQALEAFIKSSPELATAMQLATWVRKRFERDGATPPAVPHQGTVVAPATVGQVSVTPGTPARDDESLTKVNVPIDRISAPKGPDSVPLGAIAAQVFHAPDRRSAEIAQKREEAAVPKPPRVPDARPPRRTAPPPSPPAIDPDDEPTLHVPERPVAELERREMLERSKEASAPPPSPSGVPMLRAPTQGGPTPNAPIPSLVQSGPSAPVPGAPIPSLVQSGPVIAPIPSLASGQVIAPIPSLAQSGPVSAPAQSGSMPMARAPTQSGPSLSGPMPMARGQTQSGPMIAPAMSDSAPRYRRTHSHRPRWMRLGVPIAAMVGLAVLSFAISLAISKRHVATAAHVTAPTVAPVTPMTVTPASDAAVPSDASTDAYLQITTTPPGATIVIGDQAQRSPTDLVVASGAVHVSVELAGYQSETRVVVIAAGAHEQLAVTLHKR